MSAGYVLGYGALAMDRTHAPLSVASRADANGADAERASNAHAHAVKAAAHPPALSIGETGLPSTRIAPARAASDARRAWSS